jgi:hypothetical protein
MEGKIMVVMAYRTQDGLSDYGFSIEFESIEGWKVYIIFAPSIRGRDDSSRFPYQSVAADGRRYVDWPSKVDNLGDAKTVAQLWAESAQSYQRTQEKYNLYAELIQRYECTRGQKGDNKKQRSTRTPRRAGRVKTQSDRPHAAS